MTTNNIFVRNCNSTRLPKSPKCNEVELGRTTRKFRSAPLAALVNVILMRHCIAIASFLLTASFVFANGEAIPIEVTGLTEETGITVSDLPPATTISPWMNMFSKGETTPPSAVFADPVPPMAIPLPGGVDVFTVENDQSAPKTERVATVEFRPSREAYIVSGRVQYRDVEGIAYLEMWNIMPDGSRYFSRTLEDVDPGKMASNSFPVLMRKISGTSEWRTFILPFNLMEHKPESVTLEINIVMPGKGTIEVTGLTVSDYPTFGGGEWFDARTATIFATVNGIFGGCYGILFGMLGGFLASRGKARRFVTGIFVFPLALGVVYSVIGIAALLCGQPFRIWWMLILSGGILLFVYSFVYFVAVRTMYKQAELRKMQALDA